MNTRLQDVLEHKGGNYILPFFWQHGEKEETLRQYMKVIHSANIGAVCIEARPHPDFNGDGWWHDMDIILDEAKKLGMKIWILDDAHFPTGQAAGKMDEAPDKLQKQYLNYNVADICGPVRQCMLQVDIMAKYYDSPLKKNSSILGEPQKRSFSDDRLLAVIASRLDGKDNNIYHMDDSLLNLTNQVMDGQLFWDVPEGYWRVLVIYETRNGGGRSNYINLLSSASCRVQLDSVYEPHYNRYKDEFGKTIAGFFSDETEIGNIPGYSFDAGIGNMNMPLPWSEEMPQLMQSRLGEDFIRFLPALWMDVASEHFTAEVRTIYMDIVTRQCQKNFSEQIGKWCRDRGVEYIGHILEDCGIHTRLGASQGHYFRALRGQDWAGIDDIGGQIVIGGENRSHKTRLGLGADGEFYHHVLAKLGTSLADIDPRKKGRVMCELFGAYGWEEGSRLMKYITDHLLVRGINRYVPHAFSPKEFPDSDCPPHFYAHGKNPMFKPFCTLMSYMNRISHLIDGGRHEVQIAVLYHAESEWAGMGYTDMGKIARMLDDVQLDFDFVPADIFTERDWFSTSLDENGLHVNGLDFKALVIPQAGYLPDSVVRFMEEAKTTKFPVLFVSDMENDYIHENGTCVSGKEKTIDFLKNTVKGVVSTTEFAQLQTYHYKQNNEHYYLISNEAVSTKYHGVLKLPSGGNLYQYDAMQNRLFTVGIGDKLELSLEPYEMVVIIASPHSEYYEKHSEIRKVPKGKKRELKLNWKVSFTDNEQYPAFNNSIEMDNLENILKVNPLFSGIIRYEAIFDSENGKEEFLELEDAYESVEVWCNGMYAGEMICPSYRFYIGDCIKKGKNEIRIEVRTTLERKVNTLTSGIGFLGPEYKVVKPEGIIGKVMVR